MIKSFYTPLLALFTGLIFIDLCGIIGKYFYKISYTQNHIDKLDAHPVVHVY